MKLVHVRTIYLSCMVGFGNYLVQIIIMTKQCVMNKNHVKGLCHSPHLNFVDRVQRNLFVSAHSLVNNVGVYE